MSYDKELEIRRQFLDEADEHLDTIDHAVLGLAHSHVDIQKINAALRAAHSIKGGAGLMGFDGLSRLAHRLEDSFKVLKVQHQTLVIDGELENRLLKAVSCLRMIVQYDRAGQAIDTTWQDTEVTPLFDALYAQLGDPEAENANSVLVTDTAPQDLIPMIFETEVESGLQRLEELLNQGGSPEAIRDEILLMAQELSGLAEMLCLGRFYSLCDSILHSLGAAAIAQVPPIATVVVKTWRQAQALVLTGQHQLVPEQFITDLSIAEPAPSVTDPFGDAFIDDATSFDWLDGAAEDAISASSFQTEPALTDSTVDTDEFSWLVNAPTAAEVVSDQIVELVEEENAPLPDLTTSEAISGKIVPSELAIDELAIGELVPSELAIDEFESSEFDTTETTSEELVSRELSHDGLAIDYPIINDQVTDQIDLQIDDQIDLQINNQIDLQINGQIDSQIGSQIDSQIDLQINGQIDSQDFNEPIFDDGVVHDLDNPTFSDPLETEIFNDTPVSHEMVTHHEIATNEPGTDEFLTQQEPKIASRDLAELDFHNVAVSLTNPAGTEPTVTDADKLGTQSWWDKYTGQTRTSSSSAHSDPSTFPASNSDASHEDDPDFDDEVIGDDDASESSLLLPEEEDQDATVRVSVRQLNQLNDLFGELTIERNGLEAYLKRLRGLTRTLTQRVRLLDQSNYQLRTNYDRVTLQTTFGVPLGNLSASGMTDENVLLQLADQRWQLETPMTQNFDVLEMDQYSDLNLLSQQVMETIVQIQEVTNDIDLTLEDAEQTTRNLNRTSRQLQRNLTQIRMRPLSDIVDRFPRALREMSLQYNKRVKLTIDGGDTLIERNLLEALNDPLMHLLRNAFDHGLEDPATRKANGKSEEGHIRIQASHQGNRTLITLTDDGRGISVEKIRAKAERMGLDASLLDDASDDELVSLIFEPGFSTSDQVTELSGRGVGMDAVRAGLQQIRGDVNVSTQAGKGTTFTLSIPHTLSVVNVLLVESHGSLLAVPRETIEESVMLWPEDILLRGGKEYLNWRDREISLFSLASWLSFNCPNPPYSLDGTASIDSNSVLVLTHNGQPIGLKVDRCWGEQEVALRRIEGSIALPSGFVGCAIVGNGRVVPLIGLAEVLKILTRDRRPVAEPVDTLPEVPTEQPPTILIIDDSINVRRFLALTLERGGFQVEQATDGQDAYEKLLRGLSVQAIICDIEMPRLDGYGFLAKAKSTPELRHLPIAMLTSRSGDKHRQLAMSLGASAYFTKPYNEPDMLRELNELIAQPAMV